MDNTWTPLTTLALQNDTYRMQRRPGTSQLFLNDDYAGLLVVDPWRGVVSRVAFPRDFESGVIDGWYLGADGNKVLVIAVEDMQAVLLWLDGQRPPQILSVPPLANPTNLAVYWPNETLVLARPDPAPFFTLDVMAPTPMYLQQPSIAIRQQYRAWRSALDRVPSVARIVRVEADREQLVYVDASTNPAHLGVVNWQTQVAWSFPLTGARVPPPLLATTPQGLCALYEYEVQMFTQQGEMVAQISAPTGFHFWGVETVSAAPPHPSAVVVLAVSLSDYRETRLLVYALPEV